MGKFVSAVMNVRNALKCARESSTDETRMKSVSKVKEFAQEVAEAETRLAPQSSFRNAREGTLALTASAQHVYVAVEREQWKLDTLCDLYENFPHKQVIIFCNCVRKVYFLETQM